MNIKGLLLGSAAALVAVSGARAADAVMAPEPEPVEYVRVCDAYGSGFFYIPGTETCLQISGYIWYQVGASSHMADAWPVGIQPGTTSNSFAMAGDGWEKNVETRINFDARSETEWGTLRSYIRFNASWNGVGDGAVTTDQAIIQLGGFTMGYTESFWVDSQDGNAANYGSHSWHGMYYSYQQRALIGYTFNSNGFFGAISLEDDTLAGDGYMPDVVAKLGYGGDWGAVWVKVAYDESFDGSLFQADAAVLAPGFVTSSGLAAQIGAQFNIPNLPGSSLRVIGFWADGANQYNAGSPTVVYGPTAFSYYGGAEWSILASYNHQFSETLGASVAFQYFNDLYYSSTDIGSGVDAWSAELSVVWLPVTNFEVRAELHYDDVGSFRAPAVPVGDPDGTVSGYLRFTRYF